MCNNWFKIYIKNISQSKIFFLWNIIGLAVGMASLILGFTYYKSEYSYNRWIPEVADMYELNLDMGEQASSIFIPGGVGPFLLESELSEAHCYFALEYLDFYGESTETQGIVHKILNTQHTFFDFFPFRFKYGSKQEVFVQDNAIAISSSLAERFFGEHNPVGDTLSLAHQKYVIGGVYELDKQATIMPDVVLPTIEYHTSDDASLWQENVGGLVFKKKKEVATAEILTRLAAVYHTKKTINKFFVERGDEVTPRLVHFEEARFDSKQISLLEGKTKKETVQLILICSFLIFWLTLVNYISLNQSNVLRRAKEFSLRRIIGASKGQLIGQLLFETLINITIALCIALVFVELSLPIYNNFLHQQLIFSWRDLGVIILGVVFGILFIGGLLPGWYASVIAQQNTKGGQVQLRSRMSRWRITFMGIQLFVAFFFLIAGGLVYKQVDYMQRRDTGFKGELVYQVKLYTQQIKRKLYRTPKLLEEIRQIHGIQEVGLSTISFKGNRVNTNHAIYYQQQQITDFVLDGVDDAYMAMMGFTVLAEMKDIEEELPTVYVNETFVKKLSKQVDEMLGEVIAYEGNTFIIKGVIGDFNRDGFEEEIKPMLLFYYSDIDFLPYGIGSMSVQLIPGKEEETLERLQAFWIVHVDYEYPFESIRVRDQFAQTYNKTQSQLNMFVLWNVAVVLIALFGVYAVMSFATEHRLKELVIRKVLGASEKELILTLLKPFLYTLMLAYVLVLYPTYWLMSMWLDKFTDRIEISIVPFAVSFVVLTSIIILVLFKKISKAVQADVIKYIKYE